MSGPIRVFVVAAVRLYEQGLSEVLSREPGFCVVGTARAALEGVHRMGALETPPHVALIDLGMPAGLVAIRALRDRLPAVRQIALAVTEAEPDVIAWAEAGVDGFVSCDASLADLKATIEAVVAGEMPCSPRVAATLLKRVATLADGRRSPTVRSRLTAREYEIVGLIDHGLSNKEIATRLSIGVPTVKNHVHNLLEKLHVTRRAEAAALVRADRHE